MTDTDAAVPSNHASGHVSTRTSGPAVTQPVLRLQGIRKIGRAHV